MLRSKPPPRPAAPASVTLEALAWVRNRVRRPRPRGWEKVVSELEVLPEHAARLEGIERYSHLIVVFYMDLAKGAPEKPDTLTLASGREYGTFALRTQVRPNYLGISVVELLGRRGATLRVRGLDALDGTPVLDIKPYLPEYDSVPGARVP